MTVTLASHIRSYLGLSSDTKPTGVPVGSTFFETDTSVTSIFDGTSWWRQAVASGYALIKVTEIKSGSSYSYTTGARALFVECIGGGGAGGSCATGATNAAAAGGGGAGAYSCAFLTGLPANPVTVAVGAGGTPGAAGANPGGNGGDTTFGSPSVCTAKGGAGGSASTVAAGPVIGGAGGAGGASSAGVGDLVVDGEPGGTGLMLAAAQALSGQGGDSVFGGGGQGQTTQHAGVAGGNYGAGGSGGAILSGGASVAGGAGSAGIIRVFEYA
jgi:hypothetical protein